MKQFGIRVRVVLPGRAPDTRFSDNARTRMVNGFPKAYAEIVRGVVAGWEQDTGPMTAAGDVAEAVWRAVIEENSPAHIPAGADAIALAANP